MFHHFYYSLSLCLILRLLDSSPTQEENATVVHKQVKADSISKCSLFKTAVSMLDRDLSCTQSVKENLNLSAIENTHLSQLTTAQIKGSNTKSSKFSIFLITKKAAQLAHARRTSNS
jgi:hypothetical protein